MRRTNILTLLASLCFVHVALAAAPQGVERGVQLYEDGRWIDARLSLLEARGAIDRSQRADIELLDYYIAMCAIELDDPEAEHYLLEFERNYPLSMRLNEVRLARALLYCSEERYAEAREAFALVEYNKLDDKQREAYDIRMGYIEFVEGEYLLSRGYLNNIKRNSPIFHHALYYNSYIDYIQSDNQAAIKGFTELLDNDTYAEIAPFYLLQIEFNEGDYAKVLSQGEELYPKATEMRAREVIRTMAESAFRLEQFSEAINFIRRYEAAGGEMGREENYILGFSLYRTVCYDEALDYLRKACGADDALTQNASYHLADCYLRAGDKSMAAKSFAMASSEEYSAEIAKDALFNYAKLQYELGNDRFSETINTLTRYLNRYPASDTHYTEAKELLIAIYYNSRDYDAAYKSIKELKNPDSEVRLALQRIALYRGLESFNRGDYVNATAQLKESLEVNISPKFSSIARLYLGEMAFAEDRYQEALQRYNDYLVVAPTDDSNYSLALYNIAYAKMMLDDESEALGYFDRFIGGVAEDDFYRADALNRAGDILYGKRQFEQARENYKRSSWSKFEPRHYALYQCAIIDGILGDYAAKIKRLKSIVSIGEGKYIEPSMYELGRSYIAASDYKSGVESHEAFIKRFPSSDRYAQALSDLGLAYLNLGDGKSSLEYYDLAINAAPQSSVAKDALQGVREIYINRGDAAGYFKYAASIGHSGDLDNMMRDSLSFASAQRLYINGEGQSEAAVNALSDYIHDYPSGYYTLDALYFLGDSYVKLDRRVDAISILKQLSERGAGQYAQRVYERLSSLTYAEKRYGESAQAYLELYKLSGKAEVKSRALAGYVDATLLHSDPSTTVSMADFVVAQQGADPSLSVRANHAKAKILMERGERDSALVLFERLSSDPLSAEGAEALYILIEAQVDAGNSDRAEQMVFDFAKSDTPQNYFLAKAFILLGDIYVQKDDNFQARATYQSIIDGYGVQGDGIIELARAKINKLP